MTKVQKLRVFHVLTMLLALLVVAVAGTAKLSASAMAASHPVTRANTHGAGPNTLWPLPRLSSKIQYVVVIIQENRSFDNMFNGFPGANTQNYGYDSQGNLVQLQPVPQEDGHDPAHTHIAFETAYDGGRNDAFDLEGFDSNPTSTPDYQYAYVPSNETADYWTYAGNNALADNFFVSNSGPSYPTHQYFIAGQSDRVAEVPNGFPWGCDSPPSTTTTVLNHRGQEVTGPFPCFDYATVGDLLDAGGISWAYYTPPLNGEGGLWNAYDSINHIRYGADWANIITPETTILGDVQNGTLRQVSYVVPSCGNSDHAICGGNGGPAWVSSIVDAVGNSPYWNSTAVFVVWDEWGGWFDHVAPQQFGDKMGLNFRSPLIAISPYSKIGYVSHVRHESTSIIKFIEHTFHLGSLGTNAERRADDLHDMFNLHQHPHGLASRRSRAAQRLNIQHFIHQRPAPRVLHND
ncbi:MAG: hypothetical protein JO043_01270 [Candidatus Eremiobacteraeota bacterium]|nr:hypothetical protein [Candidatus Eremiobacteraeota bacterium]